MAKTLYFIVCIIISACINQNYTSLELNIVSKSRDTILIIKELYLASLTKSDKKKSFKNIDCIGPNKFIFRNLTEGSFTGLIRIEKNNSLYSISIDSIKILKGKNTITKEINLGSIQL